MHRCPRCNGKEGDVEFSMRAGGTPNSYCKECQRKYARRHYRKNKKTYNDLRRARHAKRRAEFRERMRKLKTRCVDCNKKHPYWRMQFDHLPGHKKIGNIGSMITGMWSWEKILEEIKKCEAVCANCHADRTHKRQLGVAQTGRAHGSGP